MPNHVTNVIKMRGITNLPLFTEEDGVRRFDFNKLIQMPESLNIESGGMEYESIIYFLTEKCTIPLTCLDDNKKEIISKAIARDFFNDEWVQTVFNRALELVCQKICDGTELYKLGERYVQNYVKYGYTTWYDWCIENWGTKWNAYSNKCRDVDTIQFDTAWGRPEPILKKLTEMYPSARIEHWWADEDTGYNTGHIVYENGEILGGPAINASHEAYEIYIFCKGESECLQKVDGMWRHRDCDTCNGC